VTRPAHLLSRPRATIAARHVARRNALVYFGSWKSNIFPPMLEPVLWLFAIGYGLGRFIEDIDGQSYILFIAPALLAIEAMNAAFFECSYGSFVRMHYQKTYQAITATPLNLDDVVLGEFLWAAGKAGLQGVIVLAVLLAFGLVQTPLLALAIPVVIVVAFLFAAIGILTSAVAPGFDTFNYPMYLYITPQFFLSGTFFPLSEFPTTFQYVAYTLPLTHATIAVRGLANDAWGTTEWLSLAWLLFVATVLTIAGINAMKRRLIQ
jgi:lipooligosaccharide transport system permease protein